MVAVDKSQKLNSTFEAHPNLITKCADITDWNAIKELAKELGSIDVLVNCAG